MADHDGNLPQVSTNRTQIQNEGSCLKWVAAQRRLLLEKKGYVNIAEVTQPRTLNKRADIRAQNGPQRLGLWAEGTVDQGGDLIHLFQYDDYVEYTGIN